jgi:hypothetical protein
MEGPVESVEKQYVEPSFELVQRCQKFMELHHDLTITKVVNPFSERPIKKGSSTYFNVYSQVRRYLASLDDEEFHSPIKGLEIISHEVPPLLEIQSPERYLTETSTQDEILVDWHKKLEKKLEKLKTEKNVKHEEERYLNYKYDEPIMTIFSTEQEFENRKRSWIEKNIELYSFLDHYKPEIFENKYITKQLIIYNYSNMEEFTQWLSKCCETFLVKRYDQPYHTNPTLNSYQRYPTSLINLWIYQPLIESARRFLKKNKSKIITYLSTKPSHDIKLKKQHFSSLILGFFISKTSIIELQKIKENYDGYFDHQLNEFFKFSDKEKIYNRAYYAMILTDFLGNRIKPYRHTHMKFEDLEHFDVIMKNLNDPPKPQSQEEANDE